MTLFCDFLQRRFGARPFVPDPAKPDEQIFAVSLESFRALIGNGAFRNEAGEALRIEAGFADTLTPDAHADQENGTHFVIMHQALLATIVEFSLFLFTQSYLLPDIGKASGEESPSFESDEAPGLRALRVTLDGAAIDPERDRVRVPRCEDRHVAAIYMALVMSRFVWFHELAHCINGHVLFLQREKVSGAIISAVAPLGLVSFTRADGDIHNRRRLRHALEMDADATAFEWLLRIQHGGAENITGLLAYDEAQRFKMTVIGTYMMTWLFEEYQRFADARHDLTHPAPRDRLAFLRGLMDAAARHPALAHALEEVRATLDQLSNHISGFRFVAAQAATLVTDIDLDRALTPYRFR